MNKKGPRPNSCSETKNPARVSNRLAGLVVKAGVLTVFAHHRFANQSDGGRIIPSSLFARLANQYFGINEQSVTNKSFQNTRLSGRLHYEP